VWGQVFIGSNLLLSDCSALAKVVDEIDDGFIGPNEFTSDPSLFPPDVFNGGLSFGFEDPSIPGTNATGCNTIAEILGSVGGEGGVFKDSFESTNP